MAHKLWLQYAQMLSNHCNSRILVSAIFSRLFWNITCLDLECKQCKLELDIMYYSAVANCLNYLAHIPKPCIIEVGVAIHHIKLACHTPWEALPIQLFNHNTTLFGSCSVISTKTRPLFATWLLVFRATLVS